MPSFNLFFFKSSKIKLEDVVSVIFGLFKSGLSAIFIVYDSASLSCFHEKETLSEFSSVSIIPLLKGIYTHGTGRVPFCAIEKCPVAEEDAKPLRLIT